MVAAVGVLMTVVTACSDSRSVVASIELNEAPSICAQPSFSIAGSRWRSNERLSLEESRAPLAGDLIVFDNDTATLTLESGRELDFEVQRGITTLECSLPN